MSLLGVTIYGDTSRPSKTISGDSREMLRPQLSRPRLVACFDQLNSYSRAIDDSGQPTIELLLYSDDDEAFNKMDAKVTREWERLTKAEQDAYDEIYPE